MKTKMIDGKMGDKVIVDRYELIECTAIAFSADETTEDRRQDCILVNDRAADFDSFCVLFGYESVDEISEDNWDDICKYDADAFSMDGEDLASVLIDGHPINYYSWGTIEKSELY